MQATVYRYDPASGSGAVLTDQGAVLPFTVEALRLSGLRHLRPGQRLTVELDEGRRVSALRLETIGSTLRDPETQPRS
jgi:cold shock CspA family protein